MIDENFGKNLGKLLGSAREMQTKMEAAQKEVSELRVTGEAGGGMVRATVNGNRRVVKVAISDEAMEDREMLQDLIAAAVSDAMGKVEQEINSKMHSMLASGMGVPGF